MEIAPSAAASFFPWSPPATVPDTWFDDLRQALSALERIPSSNYAYTSEQIRQLIVTYLGSDLPHKATEWCVTHCDVHWANVTAPKFALLDWENWGLAPRGYGPARLLVMSATDPDMVRRVESEFAMDFKTSSGCVALFAAIAHVIMQISIGEAPVALSKPVEDLASDFVSRLSLWRQRLRPPPYALAGW